MDDKFMTKVLSYDGCAYEEDEMISMFPCGVKSDVVCQPDNEVLPVKKSENKKPSPLYEAMVSQDNASMLLQLSGTNFVKGQVITIEDDKQIWCDGKRTGCWIVDD
jgi:hypothetical protein